MSVQCIGRWMGQLGCKRAAFIATKMIDATRHTCPQACMPTRNRAKLYQYAKPTVVISCLSVGNLAAPLAITGDGVVQGYVETVKGVSVASFRGIPYAAPPIGRSGRWKPAQSSVRLH
jgi:hypothetical protein